MGSNGSFSSLIAVLREEMIYESGNAARESGVQIRFSIRNPNPE